MIILWNILTNECSFFLFLIHSPVLTVKLSEEKYKTSFGTVSCYHNYSTVKYAYHISMKIYFQFCAMTQLDTTDLDTTIDKKFDSCAGGLIFGRQM
jgi:hypothetical protein